ncbi:DUF4430 domain-containing protein [Caproiciproducens galactitolivorans]|uniref:Transcobalamin-like C-terminal domain-containing protein n=1 Tax=Caproiciproducens galactitolivorans TaxID=642589 RepID=A0A4Z0YF15_9FIRM|nr:DUF4430 domain-containing protein [Caproiciproducens galactitolivorans]QEY35775.1 DUF4430 domain-containing protein [Caproiciproducens galactitolivorans]TGJ77510.1 hypothetical protein CAGA_08820 [Caproiciproducens galactitolivorans]
MKYIRKIFALFCIFAVLSGCKAKFPSQHAAISAGAPESSAISSEIAGQGETSGAAFSANVSQTAPNTASGSAKMIKKELRCTLFISCNDILKNREKFSEDKLSLVPKDGVILAEKSVEIKNGETVYDVLLRETKSNGIPMESASAPVYQSIYIKGIHNIYEKDFGASSGWTYTVNGKQPPVGCNQYQLKNGDKIQWLFICGA